jgi:hypothetical protein
MRKQLTGAPVAGKPHTGYAGRGRRSPFPTPIRRPLTDDRHKFRRVVGCKRQAAIRASISSCRTWSVTAAPICSHRRRRRMRWANVESETESSNAKRVTSLLIPHDNVSVPKRNSARVEGLVLRKEEGAGHSQCKCNDWRSSLRPAHFLMQRDARTWRSAYQTDVRGEIVEADSGGSVPPQAPQYIGHCSTRRVRRNTVLASLDRRPAEMKACR